MLPGQTKTERDTHFARVLKCEPAAGSFCWPVAEEH